MKLKANEAPSPNTVPPVISMTPPQYLPPQYLPPSKFYHPIVVYQPTTTEKAPSASTNIFLPTIQSFNDKTKRDETTITPKSSFAKLSDFDKNINTSYVPREIHAIREAMESNYFNNELDNPLNETLTSEDLQRFPPNTNSIYLPQETKDSINLVDSYLPAPSGNFRNKLNKDSRNLFDYTTKKGGIADEDLQQFPPNVNSSYDSKINQSTIELVNSYVPNPSGDPKNSQVEQNFPFNIDSIRDSPDFLSPHSIIPKDNSQKHPDSDETTSLVIDLSATELPASAEGPEISYIPPSNLHVFPPNLQSFYLPPEMMKHTSLINSYIPPASGVKNIQTEALTSMLKTHPNAYYYAKPSDMKPMPPPAMMDQMPGMMEQPPSSPGMMDLVPSGPENHSHHRPQPWDYSDLIFDDPHHHHHHHPHVEEETTTSTTAAPEEPRVKKYSYYYLGRKLWYLYTF